MMPGVEFAGDALACVAGADAVVLVTEWGEFLDLDWAAVAGAMSGDVVIDGRNALDREAVEGAGLRYEGVGRATGSEDDAGRQPAGVSGADAEPAGLGSGPG